MTTTPQTEAESRAALLALAEEAARDVATPAEAEALADQITMELRQWDAAVWSPYPWQRPHTHPPGWSGPCTEECESFPTATILTHGAWLLMGGRGCVAGWTRVYLPDEDRHERIDTLAAAGHPVRVLSLTADGPAAHATDGAPFLKGWAHTWTIRTASGARLTATDQHRLLTPQGWLPLAHVRVGQPLGGGAPAPPPGVSLLPSRWLADAPRSTGTPGGSLAGYPTCHRSGDPLPPRLRAVARVPAPSLAGAALRNRGTPRPDDSDAGPGCSPARLRGIPLARTGSGPVGPSAPGGRYPAAPSPAAPPHPSDRAEHLSPRTSYPLPPTPGAGRRCTPTAPGSLPLPSPAPGESDSSYPHPTYCDRVVSVTYTGWLPFYDMTVPGPENYAAEGLWHHNTGKSDGAARYVAEHVAGPACDTRLPGGHKMIMVAPTQGDAVEVINGPSGLTTVAPGTALVGGAGGLAVRFPGGARMRVLGAYTPDDENRLRAAGNNCLVYLEEAAAMRHLKVAIEQTAMGLRIGSRAHYVVATTPKPRKEVQALIDDPLTVRTWGTTDRAVHLDPNVRAVLERKHGGTRLGRQELGGEVLGDVEGALWVHEQTYEDPEDARPGIENDRLTASDVGWTSHHPDAPPSTADALVHRLVIAVDPAGTAQGDEAGIIAVGSIGNQGYVLADLSAHLTPDQSARLAVQAYYDFGAEGIALERYGGETFTSVIRSVVLTDGRRGDQVPIFPVPTKVGKRLRAEPVQALYEQHRIHHVGVHPELEDQMTSWVPDESPGSPDRVDALVHGLTYLLIRSAASTIASPAAGATNSAPNSPLPPGRTGLGRRIR